MTGRPKAKTWRIPSESHREVLVTLKSNCFNLFDFGSGNLWTFDLEGRLMGMYVDQVNYRRTLDNRFFAKSRKSGNGQTFRTVEHVSLKSAGGLIDRARSLLLFVQPRLPGELNGYVQKILRMDMPSLEKSGEAFSGIYLPVSVLPPDQYMSLVLQITEGCNYDQCVFCTFYSDRRFRIKPLDEIEEHIGQVKRFFGAGLMLRKTVFLADANALVIPQSRLLPILGSVNDLLPQFKSIYSFIDVFTGIKKSARDFSDLKELRLKRLYLGVESGNSELLDLLKKPQLVSDVIVLAERIKAGGVNLGLIFLAGAGGLAFHSKHLADSVRLIESIPLSSHDLVYISELYGNSREYHLALEERGVPLPSRQETRRMAIEFKTAVTKVVPKGVAVPVYDIRQFFY
ncbi:MAG: radical SAM protein [Candidatus Neomarinimicrobiota bacterium]